MAATGAIVYLPLRAVSGLWSGGVTAADDYTDLKAWLPPARQPIAYEDRGRLLVNPTWYRFFWFLCEVKLGGIDGPTVPDVSAAVDATVATSSTASATANAVAQQASQNAASLAATVDVARNNSLVVS